MTHEVSDVELGLSNFNIFRADRSFSVSGKVRGGGVLVAVKKDICSSTIFIGQSVESIYLRLQIKEFNFIVGGVYIPPGSAEVIYKNHCDDLEIVIYATSSG